MPKCHICKRELELHSASSDLFKDEKRSWIDVYYCRMCKSILSKEEVKKSRTIKREVS